MILQRPTAAQRLAERSPPASAVAMYQRWEHLAFLHWRFDQEQVQRSLPPGLIVDVSDGDAWVGLVPIFLRNVRPRFIPSIPYLSDFLELNLRTYVYDAAGRPGIYFYSLACDQPLAVEGARRFLGLNYEHAEMKGEVDENGCVTLDSQRFGSVSSDRLVYAAVGGPARTAAEGTLEFFLIERYRLFAGDGEGLSSIRVHHAPYRLRDVKVAEWGRQSFVAAGLPPPDRDPDHLCAADTVELQVFLPQPAAD